MRGVKVVGISAAIGLAAAWPACAHTVGGAGTGFGAGLAHPFLGLDHLLALLAVGLWAGQQRGRARLAVPAAFVAVMAGGALAAVAGLSLPGVEPGLAASVLVLGLLVASRTRLPLPAGLALVAGFAALHGHAHGTELAPAGPVALWLLVLALATGLLHGAGFLLGEALRRLSGEAWLRAGGGVIAATGAPAWLAG